MRRPPEAGTYPELPLKSPTRSRAAKRASLLLGLALYAAPAAGARALDPSAGLCQPPRTIVALTPIADRTDGVWTTWSGQSPALLVTRLLADTLSHGLGCEVLRLSESPAHGPAS